MRRKIVAGNWKMYKDKSETIELIKGIKFRVSEISDKVQIIICPPFTSLQIASEMITGTKIKLGAQNAYTENEGAYTGEISPKMLKSYDVDFVIIGHSERRTYFKESNQFLNKKLRAVLSNNLNPIFCIGETLEEREQNKTFQVIETQVKEGLDSITEAELQRIIIAYEPVWAIGTGRTATPAQAEEVHLYIRNLIEEIYSKKAAKNLIIQYGGSVKPENAKELFSQPNIDGGLIGGACLKADSFLAIIKAAE